MTTPVQTVTPFKWKTLIAGIGGLLTVIVPLITQLAVHLPPEWQGIIGGIIAALTVFGVYQAPYKPPDTILVPAQPTPTSPAAPPAPPPPGGYVNPWKP